MSCQTSVSRSRPRESGTPLLTLTPEICWLKLFSSKAKVLYLASGKIKTEEKSVMKESFLRTHLLPQIAFFTMGMPRNGSISVDITSRCNLRCKHCYYFNFNNEEVTTELSDIEWQEKLIKLKKRSLFSHSCTFVGGEPLIRKELVRKLTRYFRYNLVVTNGSIALPYWKDVFFHVSVDGTEEVHDEIRSQKGLYQRIKKNICENARDMHITIVTCLTNENKHCIEELVQDWFNKTPTQGFIFDFYTPSINDDKDRFVIPHAERDKIIDQMVELRKKYGNFIRIPADVYDLMRSGNYRKVVKNCIFRRRCAAFDSMGNKKPKCVLGGSANCDLCGCIVPYYLHFRLNKKFIVNDVKKSLKALLQGSTLMS